MVVRHIPHSTKWFEAVGLADPKMAARVANLLDREGLDEICGDCGAFPASDYELQGVAWADGSIPTLRLCEVCAVIKRGLGERWTPIAG